VAREQRKLAAILAADVVGYSRLMGRGEGGTLARLRKNRSERLEPVLAKYGGRLVKLTGDGALVEFASAVDALSAAIEFQQAMIEANRGQPADTALVFRMGLHVGDLIVDGDDLYGDGVNIAARLEAEAPPGGIIVSRAVREAVEGRAKAKLHALGELALKNIERPIRAFRVEWEAADWPLMIGTSGQQHQPATPYTPQLPLPDKPSIAVLPFQNMSGDPEQEYFADGMVEEIITALSRIRWLFVIARNSSFTYKGQAVDVKRVGRELGVRYVLEGSIRRAGTRIRITGQLIDATSGSHLWADRFDGALENVFELQDNVALSVAGIIEPTLQAAEMQRSTRCPTDDLTAYDLYLQARAAAQIWDKQAPWLLGAHAGPLGAAMEWLSDCEQSNGMIRVSTGDHRHLERMQGHRHYRRRMQIQGATMTKGKNTTAKAQSAATRTVQPKPPAGKAKSKLGQLETMLRRPDGATLEQISKALHWQTHSVRGAMSGALKKKQGLTITSEKAQDGRRIYRIAA
jgi:adenylate cyclase